MVAYLDVLAAGRGLFIDLLFLIQKEKCTI